MGNIGLSDRDLDRADPIEFLEGDRDVEEDRNRNEMDDPLGLRIVDVRANVLDGLYVRRYLDVTDALDDLDGTVVWRRSERPDEE